MVLLSVYQMGSFIDCCDCQWEIQDDDDYSSDQEAMKAIYPQYLNQPIDWKKFDDFDIDALLSESQG